MPTQFWYRYAPRLTFLRRKRERANYEPEMELLDVLCDRSGTSIDVGAKYGMYAYRMVPHSRDVIAFEPIPLFHHMLRAALPRVRIEPYAVSSTVGRATLRMPFAQDGGRRFGRSTIEPNNPLRHAQIARIEELEVQTRTLDSYDLADVALIKIDVEGHELAVLEGAAATIARSHPTLLIECNDEHQPDAVAQLRAWFAAHDYTAWFIDDQVLRPIEDYVVDVHWRLHQIENFIGVHRSRPDVLEALARRVDGGDPIGTGWRQLSREPVPFRTAVASWTGRRVHRTLRWIGAHKASKRGAAWINRRLDHVFSSSRPRWLLAPGRAGWPTMVLDVSTNLQRKFFYFPKVYSRFYGDNPFRDYLTATLAPGATFIEVGANVGFFALLAASLVGPTGHVHAFEPEPSISESLRRSARANGYAQLHVHRYALSNREDELAFFRARDGTASSLVPEAPGREHRYEATLEVRVTSLDRLIAEGVLAPQSVAVIKIDVEGEECRTIEGMLGLLASAGYPPLWCEVRGPEGSTRAPNTFRDVLALLAPLGYRAYLWSRSGKRGIDVADIVKRADVLFERA